MHVAEFSIRRWQFTLVVFLGVALLGVASLVSIPKTEDPTVSFPSFAIVAVLPGATPSDVERLVVDPVEARMKALADVKTMRTIIRDGVAVVQVEFVVGSDEARKRDDVLREVTAVRPTLPPQILRLDVQEFDPDQVNVVELALAGEVPYRELDALARTLKKRIEAVPGVGTVEIAGLPAQEVRVALAPERMAGLGVGAGEVIAALGAGSVAIPAGSVDAGARNLAVKTGGDFESVDEIRDTAVRIVDGRSVRVGDVAEVVQGDGEPVHLARVDGRRAVLVSANQKDGQNVFDVAKGIEAAAKQFEAELPRDVTLVRAFDQSRNVAHRLGGFGRDFLIAIALVLVTLLPLGTRASVVVMVSIPLSLAIGVTLLHLTGYSVNQLSIVGFVIALGLLVDDSVVVVENIARFLRQGYSPREAAIRATKQITLSVLGCTATLLFAFLPLLALPGGPGLFIRPMPVALVFTIAASLVVSLTIVPFLSSVVLRSAGEHGNVFFRALTWAIHASYRRLLGEAVARPRTTLAVAALLFAGSLALVPVIGFSLFPKSGLPQFRVEIDAPEGASLAETDRAVRFVEGVLARHPEIRHVVANVGKGNPRVYYNVAPRNEASNAGEILAEVSTYEHDVIDRVLGEVRGELAGYPGATLEVKEFEQGPPVDAPIAFRVLGDDPEALGQAARKVEGILAATEGTRYVRNPSADRKSDLRVRIDSDRATLVGVPAKEVDRAVRLAVGGVVAGRYREGASDEAVDIRVTLPRSETALPGGPRPGLGVLERLYLAGATGPVPLSQVADLSLEPSPTRIDHTDKVRSTTVTAWVKEGYNTDRLTRTVLSTIRAESWPKDVQIVPAGEFESRQESFGGLGTAIIVAAVGVLAILVLEFRTFRSTLIVASVIPLGVVGGLVALLLSGYTLSFTAVVGFVALMGIEVKNSILLVDFTNQLREEGVGLDEAIQRAGETRFVPILLTTLTSMGGLLPLALERSALYSPLAFVILGGLVSSTILTRVVTPVLYKLLAPRVAPRADANEREEPGALGAAAAA